ncbi:PREDICTED: mitochondrial import receptor subunit TOM40-1-like [Camelina sativa]|uniref:Mitochondrial import receptor subunit TOM40-1-like n=1 Tax=Camelina sativa TaxID=90675 RepID=A0ABM1R890_CAMSA|nr:PREDICTED: mitochondrial import receptor subunit TOM40-1-like [Camelina sativa]
MTITAAMADLLPPSTTEQADEKTDHSSRFCPIIYDNVDKEADVSLNPNYFDGVNWNYSPAFSYKNFDIGSSMGPEHYAFDATYNFQEVFVTHDGLTASVIAPIMSEQLEPQETAVGYAARYETDKMVASAKVESSGDVLMTYVHKISKKVSLATDLVYNCLSRDVKANVGYDCNSRVSRVQGKIDSNGVVSAHLQRQLNEGLRCILSATLDLNNMAHRLGLRITYG